MKTKTILSVIALVATFTLNAQTWTMVGDPPMNGNIKTIAVDSGNKQYVAGNFSYGPVSSGLTYVAKWDFVDWADVGNFAGNGSIEKMVIDSNDKLYMIGQFVNSAGKYYVATYNGTSWSALGGLVSNNPIVDIVIDGSTIYIAGNFTSTIDGQTFYINKWNGTSWSQLDNGFFNGLVNSMSIDKDNNLNVGGTFKNNFGFYCVYKQNGNSWLEVGKLKSAYPIRKIACDKLGKVYAFHSYLNSGSQSSVLSRYNLELNTWSVLDLYYPDIKFVDHANNVYGTTSCGTPCQNIYKVYSPNSNSGVENYVSFQFGGSVTAISIDKFGYPILGSYLSSNTSGTIGIVKSSEKVQLAVNDGNIKTSTNIFPNPATGIFKIQNTDIMTNVQIYDSAGKLVKVIQPKSKEIEVNLKGSPKGVYFVKIGSDKNQTTQKLIVK